MEGLERHKPDATRYFRFNPLLGGPNDFPIDTTDTKVLSEITAVTEAYLQEPLQRKKFAQISELCDPRRGWKKWLPV